MVVDGDEVAVRVTVHLAKVKNQTRNSRQRAVVSNINNMAGKHTTAPIWKAARGKTSAPPAKTRTNPKVIRIFPRLEFTQHY